MSDFHYDVWRHPTSTGDVVEVLVHVGSGLHDPQATWSQSYGFEVTWSGLHGQSGWFAEQYAAAITFAVQTIRALAAAEQGEGR